MRKWQCVMISGITAAVMVLGGCGAAGNRTDVLSASAAGTENKQAAASSSMNVRETPVASSADSTESVSSSSDDDQALADAFNKLMDEVQDSVYPGSAGASLNAAYAGADILTWYVNNRASLTAEKITALRDAYLASQDDADSFTQQLDAVANSILYLSDDMAEGELSDAGWQGSISWTADDCTLVGQALQSSQTASADAASALQLILSTSSNDIQDENTGTILVSGSYQQLAFDGADPSAETSGTQADGSGLSAESSGTQAGCADLSTEAAAFFSSAVNSLNQDVAEKADAAVADLKVMAASDESAAATAVDEDPYYHNYESLYVQRADTHILSALSLTDSYSHGPHGSVVFAGCNYDPASGNELRVGDIFTDKDALADVIASAIADQYPDLSIQTMNNDGDAASLIREIMNNEESYGGLQFTLSPAGVTFWFSAGDLSAYAAGAQAPCIKYTDLTGIIDPAFVPETGDSCAIALPEYVPLFLADDSGRGVSSFMASSTPGSQDSSETGTVDVTVSMNDQQKTFTLSGSDPAYYLLVRGSERYLLINMHEASDQEQIHIYKLPAAVSDGDTQDTDWGSTDTAATASTGNSYGLYGHVVLNPERFLLTAKDQTSGSTGYTNIYYLDESGNPILCIQ